MHLKLIFLMLAGAGLFVIQMEILLVSVMVFTIVSFFTIAVYSDRTFTNPTATYILFFYPYSLWYVFYQLIGGEGDYSILASVVRYSYYGLLSFVGVSFLFETLFGPTKLKLDGFYNKGSISGELISWPLFVVFIVFTFQLGLSGLSSKREMMDEGGGLIYLSGFLANFITIATFITFIRKLDGSLKPNCTLIVSFSVLLFGYLIVGERDYIFRFVFVFLCVYMTFYRRGTFSFNMGVLFLLVMILPASQALKGVFVSGVAEGDIYTMRGMFFGEFTSAGRNLYMLIDHGVEDSWSYLYSDFMRGIIPFASNFDFSSTAAWYNQAYRYDHGFSGSSGWGFSIVANGYVIARGLGVVIVMSLISLILNIFHKLAKSSIYLYMFYLMLLSGAIYTIRADFAGFLSLGFKVSGAAIIGMWFLSHMLRLAKR